MQTTCEIRRLAFLGDYVPRRCGIATFTADLFDSVASQFPGSRCFVVPGNDTEDGYEYPPEVRFEIEEQNLDSYLRAADFLNITNVDAVCVQHEFGIYGGPAGSHLVPMIRALKMPVVTTFHTVMNNPNSHQPRVTQELFAYTVRA